MASSSRLVTSSSILQRLKGPHLHLISIVFRRVLLSSASLDQTIRRTIHIPSLATISSRFRFHSTDSLPDTFPFTEFSSIDAATHKEADELVEFCKKAREFPPDFDAPTDESLCLAIWSLRDDWERAVMVYGWGRRWGVASERMLCFVVWVLGTHEKFGDAWNLIRDSTRSLVDSSRVLLVMMDRYAATNNHEKAIRTFNLMEKLGISLDHRTFYYLLALLCEYGNVEEAEELMLKYKQTFPLQADSFNIILNYWCNVECDVTQAKRVWKSMAKYCVVPNEVSHTYMISCFSRVGNLFDSLRLYNEMKKRDWKPSLEVYNSLIYVLTREGCFNDAIKIIHRIKRLDLLPDNLTYNSLITSLCETNKLEEAKLVLGAMIRGNVTPTIDTYHALLGIVDLKGTMNIFVQMNIDRVGPTSDSVLLVLNKFFRWGEPQNSLSIWANVKEYKVKTKLEHYIAIVEGLVKCGDLPKAIEVYEDMISNGFVHQPKLKKLLCEFP